MTPKEAEQKAEEHLQQCLNIINKVASAKYRAGQKEHGGDLRTRPARKEILNEAIDQMFYSLVDLEQWCKCHDRVRDLDFLFSIFIEKYEIDHKDAVEFKRILDLLLQMSRD